MMGQEIKNILDENIKLKKQLLEMERVANTYQLWNTNLGIKSIIQEGKVERRFAVSSGDKLVDFCHRQNRIFIYGAGKKARRIANELLSKGVTIEAFIVSTLEKDTMFFMDRPVYAFNEINITCDDGIVIALNNANTKGAVDKILALNTRELYFAK